MDGLEQTRALAHIATGKAAQLQTPIARSPRDLHGTMPEGHLAIPGACA